MMKLIIAKMSMIRAARVVPVWRMNMQLAALEGFVARREVCLWVRVASGRSQPIRGALGHACCMPTRAPPPPCGGAPPP